MDFLKKVKEKVPGLSEATGGDGDGGEHMPRQRKKNGDVRLEPKKGPSFGLFHIHCIKLTGLPPNDNDPYCKISLVALSGNHIDTTTDVRKNQTTAQWENVCTFDVVERGLFLKIEVWDEDVGKDDRLGAVTFDLPDQSCQREVNAKLLHLGNRQELRGNCTVVYSVYYDERLEFFSALGRPRDANFDDKVEKPSPPPFSGPTVTSSVTRLLEIYTKLWGPIEAGLDLLYWKKPSHTIMFLVGWIFVCWRSLFFQAFCFIPLFILLGPVLERFGWVVKKEATAPPPVPDNPKPKEAEAGALGTMTLTVFTIAQCADMVADMFNWDFPDRAKVTFIASAVAFFVSFLIPLWFLVLWGGVYLFTIQSLYFCHPVFAQRFPPYRLVMLPYDWIMGLFTQTQVPSPVPFCGKLRVGVHRGIRLRDADLVGKSDPFIVITAEGSDEKPFVTSKKTDCVNPSWVGEEGTGYFKVQLPEKKAEVKFHVFDKDRWADDFMGEARLVLTDEGQGEATLDLYPRPEYPNDRNKYITGKLVVHYWLRGLGEGKEPPTVAQKDLGKPRLEMPPLPAPDTKIQKFFYRFVVVGDAIAALFGRNTARKLETTRPPPRPAPTSSSSSSSGGSIMSQVTGMITMLINLIMGLISGGGGTPGAKPAPSQPSGERPGGPPAGAGAGYAIPDSAVRRLVQQLPGETPAPSRPPPRSAAPQRQAPVGRENLPTRPPTRKEASAMGFGPLHQPPQGGRRREDGYESGGSVRSVHSVRSTGSRGRPISGVRTSVH